MRLAILGEVHALVSNPDLSSHENDIVPPAFKDSRLLYEIMPQLPRNSSRALSRLFSISQRNAYLQPQSANYSSRPKPETEAPGAKVGGTDMIKKQDSADVFILHRENQHAPIDHATS